MELNSASICWVSEGWYVLQDGTWFYVGNWFSQEPVEKCLRWKGILGLPLKKFTSKPVDIPHVQKTIKIPAHHVFRALTAIPDEDMDERRVFKRLNVVAPNEEVAREAIAIILKEALYTKTIDKPRHSRREIEILRSRFMPFVDNNNVYFALREFDLTWARVSKEVHTK